MKTILILRHSVMIILIIRSNMPCINVLTCTHNLSMDRNVTPQFSGVIFFFFFFFFFFSYKSSMYFSFTYPKYIKLYCSNIFLQNVAQGHNPTFFLLTPSRGRRLLVYLKGGIPRRGEQSPVEIISYKGYSPPKCTCNDCIENTFK